MHATGLREVEQLDAEMKAIGERSFGTSDVPALLQRARTDKRYLFKSSEDLIARSQAALARAKARMHDWFGLLPKADVVIERYPKFREKNGPNEIQPAGRGRQPPGGVLHQRLRGREEEPRRSGVDRVSRNDPGSPPAGRDRARAEGDPPDRALSRERRAISEGWALYAERLADEMKLFSTDLDRLGMLSSQALRASRLVVDSGIHTLGLDAPAGDRLHARAHRGGSGRRRRPRWIATSSIRVRRPRYMLGKLEISKARDEAQQGDGAAIRHQDSSTIACSRTARSRSASCTTKISAWAATVTTALDRRSAARRARRRRRLADRRRTMRGRAGSVGAHGATPAFDVQEKTIAELQAALASGAVTSRAAGPRLPRAASAPTIFRDRSSNAMIAMNPKVLEIADALDREQRARGPRGPLHGIPIVVKDNFETVDMPTTGGTLALTGFMTGRDAFQVKRLRDAGAVIIGKTNLHELAAGITTISSAGGQTRNPYDPSRTPGGSSGGTGAAVAASFAAAGMGSDTCGSIRIPSANNNLFGLRGTTGLSSRDGDHSAVAHAGHRRTAGAHASPISRSCCDATVGADPADAVTQASAGHIPSELSRAAEGRRA